MASKIKRLFGKKRDGYYEGPDLLSTPNLPSHDSPGLFGRRLQLAQGGPDRYWQDYGIQPSAGFATNDSSRPSTSFFDVTAIPFARSQTGIASGYQCSNSLGSFNFSTPSPDHLSPISVSSPDRPLSSRRRTQYVDLLDAASSSQRSNSSLSYQTPRTSQYNEDIADRNGAEGIALETDAFSPISALAKYQEHVADRNIQADAGFGAGNHENLLGRIEALSKLSGTAETASVRIKLTSSERPGTSYSAAEMYCPPPIPRGSDGTDGIVEKPVKRPCSTRSTNNIRSRRQDQQNGCPRRKMSLPGMTSNHPVNKNQIEAVGIAVSTDKSWLQRPYAPPPVSENRRSSRRVLDLTDDNNVVEITQHPLKNDPQPWEEQRPVHSDVSERVSRQPKPLGSPPSPNEIETKRPNLNEAPSNPLSVNNSTGPQDYEEDDSTPRPGLSQDSSKSRGKSPATQIMAHKRSTEVLHRKRSGRFSVGDMICSSVEDVSLHPEISSTPQKAAPVHPSIATFDGSSEADPSIPPSFRTRTRRSATAPSMPTARYSQFHSRETTNSPVQSTPQHRTRNLPYTPEGSLYNDNTLLLPGLDASHLSAETDYTLLNGGDPMSPLPSSAMFDDMIDSFQMQKDSKMAGDKRLYSIPPFQVPKRDSSLRAVVGS
jgi:hypothetical protein